MLYHKSCPGFFMLGKCSSQLIRGMLDAIDVSFVIIDLQDK